MSFLKVEGLCKSFGGLMAVHDLNFEVEEGEIIGLIGPNGSGKTTTLNLITGFLKPDSGTVTFRGENITKLPRYRACQKGIARTFQLIRPFLDFTALQNVMVGRVYGREPTKRLDTFAELMYASRHVEWTDSPLWSFVSRARRRRVREEVMLAS